VDAAMKTKTSDTPSPFESVQFATVQSAASAGGGVAALGAGSNTASAQLKDTVMGEDASYRSVASPSRHSSNIEGLPPQRKRLAFSHSIKSIKAFGSKLGARFSGGFSAEAHTLSAKHTAANEDLLKVHQCTFSKYWLVTLCRGC
jgi:hypothetical protein